MKSTKPPLIAKLPVLGLVLACASVPGEPVSAQDAQHLTITQPGGMPGLPTMTGVTRLTNGVNVTWVPSPFAP